MDLTTLSLYHCSDVNEPLRLNSMSTHIYPENVVLCARVAYCIIDLRKLSFQHKQSVHHISVMNFLVSLTASKEFALFSNN